MREELDRLSREPEKLARAVAVKPAQRSENSKSRQPASNWSLLPVNLLVESLKYLDNESLVRTLRTCHAWNAASTKAEVLFKLHYLRDWEENLANAPCIAINGPQTSWKTRCEQRARILNNWLTNQSEQRFVDLKERFGVTAKCAQLFASAKYCVLVMDLEDRTQTIALTICLETLTLVKRFVLRNGGRSMLSYVYPCEFHDGNRVLLAVPASQDSFGIWDCETGEAISFIAATQLDFVNSTTVVAINANKMSVVDLDSQKELGSYNHPSTIHYALVCKNRAFLWCYDLANINNGGIFCVNLTDFSTKGRLVGTNVFQHVGICDANRGLLYGDKEGLVQWWTGDGNEVASTSLPSKDPKHLDEFIWHRRAQISPSHHISSTCKGVVSILET